MESHSLSLLPWLQPTASGVALNLTPLGTGDAATESPFCVLSESSTLAQTLRAAFTLPGGEVLRSVWLLVQKDRYPALNDSYGMLTNEQCDTLWHNAQKALKTAHRPIFDIAPHDPKDGLPRYQSLFYCKSRQLYFHPPCPTCGQTLALCTSDELLAHKGLASYSSSLRRYLHCAACGDKSAFYVAERDSLEPEWVKDCRELVQEWSHAVLMERAIDALPCCCCEQRNSCHDSNKHFLRRLVPFRFFDFYLLAFPAYDLSLSAFAALVSGAGVSELLETPDFQSDRGQSALLHLFSERCPEGNRLFFAGTDRAFLEVLYLKLCLICQVFRYLMRLKTADVRTMFHSPTQFWVKLHGGDQRLPWFWNFAVEPLDLVYWPAQEKDVTEPALCESDLWSKVWFGLLVRNARQSFFAVCRHLPDIKQQLAADDKLFSGAVPLPECIAAENVFWSQPGVPLNDVACALWRKTLEIGGSLLTADSASRPFVAEELMVQIDELLTAIKSALFEASQTLNSATPLERPPENVAENADIARLLKDLLVKWQAQGAMQQAPAAVASETTAIDLPPAFASESSGEEIDLDKTTVIDAGTLNFAASKTWDEESPSKPTPSAEAQDLDATVALDSAQLKAMLGGDNTSEPSKVVESEPEPGGDDFDMNETVIISREELARQLGKQK